MHLGENLHKQLGIATSPMYIQSNHACPQNKNRTSAKLRSAAVRVEHTSRFATGPTVI